MKSNLKIKSAGILLSLALFSALIPHNAHAAINPGSKCSIYGQKKIFQGKSYKCIKSGKNLVWNKGSFIVLPTVTSTPTSTPTQMPVGLWQETQFKILAQFKSLKPKTIQELNFVLSPNVDKANATKLQDAYQEPITYLSNLFVSPNKATILIMNENDRDWWTNKTKELGAKIPTDWWTTRCQISLIVHCPYVSSNFDETLHAGHMLGSGLTWKDKDYTLAHHESVHIYQTGLMGNRMDYLPHWFAEGQANYLGYTFSNKFMDSRLQRNSEIWRLKAWPNVEKFNDKEWFEWIQKVESDRAYTNEGQLGYSLGELILESLYNQYDFRKVHDWMVAIKNGSDYKTGFKSTFGKEYDSWLRDTAAPYLNSQI